MSRGNLELTRLQKAIDTLAQREQDAKRIAEVYYKNGGSCVDQLHRRFIEEQSILRKKCKADGSEFLNHVGRAKLSVIEGLEERRGIMSALAKSAVRREDKYAMEMASLKKMSRRLALEG